MNAATYTIDTLTIKLFGVKGQIHRVFKDGELVQTFETKAEALAYVDAQ